MRAFLGLFLASTLSGWTWAAQSSALKLVERGPDHRLWQMVDDTSRANSPPVSHPSGFVELATGLHYWQDGEWVETEERIELTRRGAAAVRGQLKATFASENPNREGTVVLVTASAPPLRFSVIGLAYFDAASGRDALLATSQTAPGELLPPNRLAYRDAFAGLKADLVYTYRKAGLEQDIILREAPAPPANYGLNPATTRLEVLTEFFQSPEPAKQCRVLNPSRLTPRASGQPAPAWLDEELDFGGLRIGRGWAFALGKGPPAMASGDPSNPMAPIGKHWERIQGRAILFESAQFETLEPELKQLPRAVSVPSTEPPTTPQDSWRPPPDDSPPGNSRGAHLREPVKRSRTLPSLPSPVFPQNPEGIQLARIGIDQQPGVVLDFTAAVYSTSNFTFAGDTTYWVRGPLNLSGTTTIEGGTVVKFDPISSYPQLVLSGPVNCQTGPYRPAIFTARDDDSVGEILPGSTGNPGASKYALQTLRCTSISQPVNLEHLFVRFAYDGLVFDLNAPVTVRHSQFVGCHRPLIMVAGGPLYAGNLLLHQTTKEVFTQIASAVLAEHVTLVQAPALHNGYGPVELRNSLLVDLQTLQSYVGEANRQYPHGAGVFQTAGSGQFYLAENSDCRDAGTARITPSLSLELRQRTTEPPIALSNPCTADTTLWPRVRRDTDLPDLGYHYAPLDYVCSGESLEHATLTLDRGVAVGCFGAFGFELKAGSRFVSTGLPGNCNRLVRCLAVQEQIGGPWTTPVSSFEFFRLSCAAPPWPELSLRFTGLHWQADGFWRTRLFPFAVRSLARFVLQDCEWRNGRMDFFPQATRFSVQLRNNLFHRGNFIFYQDSIPGYEPFELIGFNNLFYRGSLGLYHYSTKTTWTLRDSLFDQVSLSTSSQLFNASHNAYCATLPLGGANNKFLSACDYQTGPLGEFYYPAGEDPLIVLSDPLGESEHPVSGGQLTALVDAGSRSAASAGLYHHTTIASATSREANTPVDIGFHYPATDAACQPLDSDGDGQPDAIEDTNGNGLSDTAESSWTVSNNGRNPGVSLLVFTPLNTP